LQCWCKILLESDVICLSYKKVHSGLLFSRTQCSTILQNCISVASPLSSQVLSETKLKLANIELHLIDTCHNLLN